MEKKVNVKIIEDYGVVGEDRKGNVKHFIKAEWFGKAPVYEVRTFAPDGTPKRRAGLTREEVEKLKVILNEELI